jgi:hypothetical protein
MEIITRACDAGELLRQIGATNLFAVSGGRVQVLRDGVVLPVGHGYSVRVRLLANDTYLVERVFTRSGVESVKASSRDVYCEQVGDAVYRLGCWR